MSNPYFQTLANGMKDRASELGLELTVLDPAMDAEEQLRDLMAALKDKYDIIVCSPVSPELCIPAVEAAREKGIPFVNPNQYIPGSDANINLIDYDYGKMGGEIAGSWIREHLPRDSRVVIIGYKGIEALEERSRGIRDGILLHAPDVKIVAEISALTPEQGMVETEKALTLHPETRVIAAVNDAAALGALTVLQSRKEKDELFCIVGLDATSESLKRIGRPGSIFRGTVDINPYGTGVTVIDTALKVHRNGPLREMIRIEMTPLYWDGRSSTTGQGE